MGIELRHCLLIASQLVQQRNLLQHQVVALGNELGIFLQVVKTELMGLLHPLVKLVEFHQDAGILLVKTEGTLHVLHCFLLTTLLVEASQCQITPHRRELRVELRRTLPVLDRHVILPFVVVEATEVVGRTCPVGVQPFGSFQRQNVLQSVGEAVVGLHRLSLLEASLRLVRLALHRLRIAHIIIGKGRRGLLGLGHRPDVDGFVVESGLHVVESQFVVVLATLAQQLLQLLQQVLVLGQQPLLVANAVVETVQGQRLLDEC